jgi:hypothetical protein
MGTGMNNWIAAFTVYGGELVAGGAFTMAEGSTVNRIARWQDCLDPIAGDADGDGQVDVDDLIAVMLAWGPCPAPPETCLEDVNVDGQVNVDDLVIVILNWSA